MVVQTHNIDYIIDLRQLLISFSLLNTFPLRAAITERMQNILRDNANLSKNPLELHFTYSIQESERGTVRGQGRVELADFTEV